MPCVVLHRLWYVWVILLFLAVLSLLGKTSQKCHSQCWMNYNRIVTCLANCTAAYFAERLYIQEQALWRYRIMERILVKYCKKCGGRNLVKAGHIKGEQRYKCNDCGYQFVPTRHHGKPEEDKLLAVWLYLCGIPFHTIAKLFNVTHKSVYDWVRAYSTYKYTKMEPQREASIVELDELWRYIQSNEHGSGYRKVIAVTSVNLTTGRSEGETMLHFRDFVSD